MSRKGSILRGEKWFLMNRDADGNLKEEVKKNPDLMKDINLYLEARDAKAEVEKPVKPTKSKEKK
jgi:hypothetical protein